jgi:UDP-2,3-diacylglucosamine hydrolase
MAIYAISDIHVKTDGLNSEVLKSFISLDFKEGDTIYFLGDIFDLLIGPHSQYFELFNWYFDRLRELVAKNIEIHYFEGNHDFHLEKLLGKIGIQVHKTPVVKEYFGKKFLFCHGDEIEIGNPSYKAYKGFITSKPLNFVANYIMPYSLLNFIGENASKKSRKRNKNRYGNPQENFKIRDKFREAAAIAASKYKTDIVICGHSHFRDDFEWAENRYLNCGYLPVTKNYIRIEEGQISFNPLSL